MEASDAPTPFLTFLNARLESGGFTNEDVLASVLPLFAEVLEAHEAGRVAPLNGINALQVDGHRIWFEDAKREELRLNPEALKRLQRDQSLALNIVGESRLTLDLDQDDAGSGRGVTFENLRVGKLGQRFDVPLYFPGYRSWEHEVDHHDELTDIFVLGQVMASLACGLDFTEPEELERFVTNRENLFAIQPKLHPVLASVIVRMTELQRHDRSQGLGDLIEELRNYRQIEIAEPFDTNQIDGLEEASLKGKRELVLEHLQKRLFEISRRNRLLYFKSNLGNLNLTWTSVPAMFDVSGIKPEQLFTWNPAVAKLFCSGKQFSLNPFIHLDSAPYAPGVLDKLISEARRDRAEYGFTQLRVVLCFLRWNNLKEEKEERIHSPLLLVQVELVRQVGIRDSYHIKVIDEDAEVNPVLRYYLKQLYGLRLPERVELSPEKIEAFYQDLAAQISRSGAGVALTKIDKPQIEMIHEHAKRRLNQFRRRARISGKGVRSYGELDYSYRPENFQPLGLRLFENVVKPSPPPLGGIGKGQGQLGSASGVHFSAEADEAPPPASPVSVPETEHKQRIAAMKTGSGNNPYVWDFDLCSITIGNFKYKKMTLVKDYEELLDVESGNEIENPAFDALFSLDPTRHDLDRIPQVPLADRFPVVACDPTQSSAIALARTGKSYIIQGPPGTGKSQTIANLIADFAARGKKVLFVCEKRAALDVVYHRLHQHDMADLCCLIHDSQADKKSFIHELKRTYELWLAGNPEKKSGSRSEPEKERTLAMDGVALELKALEAFNLAMRESRENASVSLRTLLHRLIELKDVLPKLEPGEQESIPFYEKWKACEAGLQRFDQTLRELEGSGVFRSHPLHRLKTDVTEQDQPMRFVQDRLDDVAARLKTMEQVLKATGQPESDWATLEKMEGLAHYAEDVRPLAERGLLALLDIQSADARAFRKGVAARKKLQHELDEALEKTERWREKIVERDLDSALREAKALEASFLRFLKPSFWRMRGLLQGRYDFMAHVVKPSWTQILEELQGEYKAVDAIKAHEAEINEVYSIEGGLDWLQETLQALGKKVNALPDHCHDLHAKLVGDRDASRTLSGMYDMVERIQKLKGTLAEFIQGSLTVSVSELNEHLDQIAEHLDTLSDFLPCLIELAAVSNEIEAVLREQDFTVAQVEGAMAERTLQQAYREDRFLKKFDGVKRERHVERLSKAYKRWESLNSDCLVSRVRKQFLTRFRKAELPASQLSAEEKAFKKRYTTGRRILEHEFGKVMRYKSIRDLVAGESSELVMDLKPVWLMSPLSVSDALPLSSDTFDVIIYDEASQITLEEAVPPLFRGPQIIVVGDQMQMPPTSFFAGKQTEDAVLLVEEDGETVEVDLEANGFLTYAARTLPATLLGWHYRSRFESLISFSNAAFYRRKLLTIPDRRVPCPTRSAIIVEAPEEGDAFAKKLLSRAVSFHYQKNAVYNKRRNSGEADYIAHMVRGLAALDTGLSIGIVAFSEAQQEHIEAALERLTQEDETFRNWLEAEFEREEDDQFLGLLIKNLENIQGDERDIIILSVCYGQDATGKMRMNFGPINQKGGEKRLNVAFSRAKRHMAVVSSIHYSAITNVYNDGANCLRQYLDYADALSRGDYDSAGRVLNGLSPLEDDKADVEVKDAVIKQLAEAIRKKGYEVDLSVGDSSFRVDLGIKAMASKSSEQDSVSEEEDDPADYLACILVDTEAHYQQEDLIERDIQRPSVLTAFGWHVTHVLTKDWYHKPEDVLNKIWKLLESGEQDAVD